MAKSTKRRCAELTKAGKPCKGTPIKATEYTTCISHAPKEVQANLGFGGPENGAKGGEARRVPKLTEVLSRRVEERADEIIDRLMSMLDARRPVVVGSGRDATVELVPDDELALKAIREIYDRFEGRPKQATELTGADGGPLTVDFPYVDQDDWNRKVAGVIGEAQSATAGAANGNGHRS